MPVLPVRRLLADAKDGRDGFPAGALPACPQYPVVLSLVEFALLFADGAEFLQRVAAAFGLMKVCTRSHFVSLC